MAKILLADDDRLQLELLERALARRGHEVETFADGAEACEALEESGYDLVVSDLKMPGRSGFDVLRAARRRSPGVPVFLLAGAWLPEERDEAERLGARGTVLKPVDFAYFYNLVEKAIVEEKHPTKKLPPEELNVPAPPKPGQAESLEAPPSPIAAPLVLVIEPDAALRKLLAYCLKRQGFRITATGDADEAVELAALEPPEAAIASGAEDDVRGIALVERLRRDPACARTYILFVYPEGAVADAVHALDIGADAALERPFEPDVLFAHVRAGLRRALKQTLVPASGNGNGNGNGHRWVSRAAN